MDALFGRPAATDRSLGWQVKGFNLRRWMDKNKKLLQGESTMLTQLAELVKNDKLRINYTEYELSTEFSEALEHAVEQRRNTKVILKMNDVGVTF